VHRQPEALDHLSGVETVQLQVVEEHLIGPGGVRAEQGLPSGVKVGR
jgi:hypothetical protein